MHPDHTVIALEGRLRACRNVITLGVKPNFADYPEADARRIETAESIYYPSSLYAELLDAMGKRIFPSLQTYLFAQDKIKQTALFSLLNIPHPRTRVFYGKRQRADVPIYFSYPFVAKIPRGSAMGRGVFLIRGDEDLQVYFNLTTVAYLQEYLPSDRDIRVVVIGKKIVHAYWRTSPDGDFRSNVAVGGSVCLDKVPDAALQLAVETARHCQWNDVGMDILPHEGSYYVLEANMKYGREGFRKAGIDYIALMEKLRQGISDRFRSFGLRILECDG